MKTYLWIVILLLFVVSTVAVQAQVEQPPAWALTMQAALDRIEAQNTQILAVLNNGVKVGPVQGEVTWGQQRIITNKSHDAALYIRNYNADGYGTYTRGTTVGLLAEGETYVGAWYVGGAQGFVAEGNSAEGMKVMGQSAGLFAQAFNGVGVKAAGTQAAVEPAWTKQGR